MAQIRPWIDKVALATRGTKTTYLGGTIRNWIDTVAIATNGTKTSYSPQELVISNINITGYVESVISLSGKVESVISLSGSL